MSARKKAARKKPVAVTEADLLAVVERTILESFNTYDQHIDPRQATYDDATGEQWNVVGGAPGINGQPATDRAGFRDEMELSRSREACRYLAERNEYVINALENRISYVIGTGHTYTLAARKYAEVDPKTLRTAQTYLDEWLYANRWGQRQQETMRRCDRDGEAFLRFFTDSEGMVRVRFVEPWQVTATNGSTDELFGIKTDPDDVETIEAYMIGGEEIDAADIQHRKANVDSNVRRGVPLFEPVRGILTQVDKILEFLSHLAKVRASYAVIRKLAGTSGAIASSFVAGKAESTHTNSSTGETRRFERIRPGAIRTASENITYEMPASNIGAADYETTIRCHLRAIASRLVMPEFMLTSDASNSNYASTLVAEGPAVKYFERLQATVRDYDLEVIWRVLEAAVGAGKLPTEVLELCDVQVGLPRVQTRNELQDAQVAQVLNLMGVKSPQTIAGDFGLDYAQEQDNLEEHAGRMGRGVPELTVPGMPGATT